MGKVLVFFTKLFPFETGETFLIKEIPFLEKKFSKVIICAPADRVIFNKYIPENTEVIYYNDDLSLVNKAIFIKQIFSIIFWKEIYQIIKKLKLKPNRNILKTLLIEILKAQNLARVLKNRIPILMKSNKVYLYSYWADYTSIAISIIKEKYPQIKACTRAHGWDLYFERHLNNYLPLRNYIFKNLDGVFFVSENGRNYTAIKYPQYANKFYTAKLGVENSANFSHQMNIDAINIVSCSHIVPVKNIPLLIDGIALINNTNLIWTHLGDGDNKQFVVEYARKKLNKNSNITQFFLGFIQNKEVTKFYTNNVVDLLINTSLSEGIPVSIMEAMSFGIPVIATAVGGTPEIVKHKYNGFLLSANPTPEEVAGAILLFYNLSIEEKNQLRQNAYNTWNKEFNAEKNYKEFVEMILSL